MFLPYHMLALVCATNEAAEAARRFQRSVETLGDAAERYPVLEVVPPPLPRGLPPDPFAEFGRVMVDEVAMDRLFADMTPFAPEPPPNRAQRRAAERAARRRRR